MGYLSRKEDHPGAGSENGKTGVDHILEWKEQSCFMKESSHDRALATGDYQSVGAFVQIRCLSDFKVRYTQCVQGTRVFGKSPPEAPVPRFSCPALRHKQPDFLLIDADHRIPQAFRYVCQQVRIIEVGNSFDYRLGAFRRVARLEDT